MTEVKTVKENARIAQQKKCIKAYQNALTKKQVKDEAVKTGKRNAH